MDIVVGHMPWGEIFEAFISSLPRRMKNEEMANVSKDPIKRLREFRTLNVGGYRRSGKTTAAFKVVRENPHARLMSSSSMEFPRLARDEKEIRSRILTLKDLDREHLTGVKLVIIDAQGFYHTSDDLLGALTLTYCKYPEWFDPEFSIIRIL